MTNPSASVEIARKHYRDWQPSYEPSEAEIAALARKLEEVKRTRELSEEEVKGIYTKNTDFVEITRVINLYRHPPAPEASSEPICLTHGDWPDIFCPFCYPPSAGSEAAPQLCYTIEQLNLMLGTREAEGVRKGVKAALEEAAKAEDGDLRALAEHIAYLIQSLLTDKYTNSFKIAHGIIEQELLRFNESRKAIRAIDPEVVAQRAAKD